MHPEVVTDNPGNCPKCGMALVEKKEGMEMAPHETKTENSYTPLIVVIGMILLVTGTITLKDFITSSFSLSQSISYFMIGFFLVFSAFKLMDLKGFAQGYSTYDLLAKKVFPYGYIYPFIELFFGLSMILLGEIAWLLIAEVLVMTFSGIGVLIKILKKEKFQCACLGTFLKVPLTKVTLIEDFGMAFLALLLLILR